MPSTGDAFERGRALGPAPLLAAMRQLAERDVYALVWADADLAVASTYGGLAAFVAIGEPLVASVYALAGMESAIGALRQHPGEALVVPDVTLVTSEGRRPRATLSISWSQADAAFVLLIARTESLSEFEVELAAQMRARLIAESELAAKTRELERVNADLERANADLQSYASVMSHDLQSPMRLLRYTLDDLETGLRDREPSTRTKITRLRELSQRMTAMLSAMLEYASTTQNDAVIEVVATRDLVDAVVTSIDVPDGMSIVVRGTWPAVATAAAPLDLVLRNLIENAVKHHDRAPGTVTVTGTRDGRWLIIAVCDDGPGIRPEHRDSIFLPFRQLRPDASGHGMGLALVRRTVESLGGEISLQSNAPSGRGATFTVRWPVQEELAWGSDPCSGG